MHFKKPAAKPHGLGGRKKRTNNETGYFTSRTFPVRRKPSVVVKVYR